MINREIHFHDHYGFVCMIKVPDGMQISIGDKIYYLYHSRVVIEVRHEIEDAKTIYIAKD